MGKIFVRERKEMEAESAADSERKEAEEETRARDAAMKADADAIAKAKSRTFETRRNSTSSSAVAMAAAAATLQQAHFSRREQHLARQKEVLRLSEDSTGQRPDNVDHSQTGVRSPLRGEELWGLLPDPVQEERQLHANRKLRHPKGPVLQAGTYKFANFGESVRRSVSPALAPPPLLIWLVERAGISNDDEGHDYPSAAQRYCETMREQGFADLSSLDGMREEELRTRFGVGCVPDHASRLERDEAAHHANNIVNAVTRDYAAPWEGGDPRVP